MIAHDFNNLLAVILSYASFVSEELTTPSGPDWPERLEEVAEKMRAIKPGIQVLFMSGYARPVLASQGSLDPSVVLVEKPLSETELLSQAGQVLDGHFSGFKTISGTDYRRH